MAATSAILLWTTILLLAGRDSPQSWRLATADTEIRIGISDNRPVIHHLGCTKEGSGVVSENDQRGGPSLHRKKATPDPFSSWVDRPVQVPLMGRVWVGDRQLPTAWVFQKAAMDAAGGRLTLAFANAEPKLALRSVWRARPGHGPIEHWLEIENQSAARVTVSHQDSLALSSLSPGGPAVLWWIRRGGGNASTQGGTFSQPVAPGLDLVLASNCEDGASPVPWLAVQVGEQRGLYVGWAFSGLGRIHAKAQSADALEIRVGNQPEFKTDVEPGETFRVPAAFVGCYAGDLDEGSYRLHRFILEKLRPPLPPDCPDPILAYNLYLDVGGNRATEADVLRSARTCRDLGFEAFMPDAMWFPETGDWRWDPRRFPRGIGPIQGFVHGAGMKMALWCAWTNGGISSDPGALSVRGPVARPEWFRGSFGPDWKPGPFYGAQLCLGSPEARQWAIRKTQWLVGHHKLDYLKHDIGPIVTSCDKKTHRHRHGVDASYWAALGYYEVQEKLRAAFPHLILENCSGGGHIKDFGVIQRTHYTVTTDTLSNLPNRQSIFDSTYAMPPLVLQAYTYDNYYPVPGDGPHNFLWRSAMMGAWQIDPTDTPKWTEEERESARRSVAIYKEWIRPMLADVKVHHVLPRPDGVRWDGLFYWSPARRRGTLYVFRPGSPEESQTVRLKGLDPAKKYRLWCEDGSIAPGVRGGSELMSRGLSIRLPSPYASDLVFLQDEALGKPAGLDPPGEFRLKAAAVRAGMFSVSAELTWEPATHARSYRVTVVDPSAGGKTVAAATVSRPAVSLESLPPGRQLQWKVEAVSWGGVQGSAGQPGQLVTPRLHRPAGIAFLSDMPWKRATAGADNPVRRDVNYHGKPISIAGKPYPKGLWTHSFPDATPADTVYDVAGKPYALFKADVGLDDASGGGSVQFQVLVDGVKKAESPVLGPRQAHCFRVEIEGAKEVTLRVLNGGDGYACDHSAWGFARFTEKGVRDPLD